MRPSPVRPGPDKPAVAVLREATAEVHARLHEHPLMVELLAHPSADRYRAVLEAFWRFYRPAEPRLVACARRFGVTEQYPRALRTARLRADLRSLDCWPPPPVAPANLHELPESQSLAALAGCLYVIKGSALGGLVIARTLRGRLPHDCGRAFLTGDGDATEREWSEFRRFCERVCRDEQTRIEAIVAAQQVFRTIEVCVARQPPTVRSR